MKRICFPNFWLNFSQTNNFFYNLLKSEKDLIIDYTKPELVIYSVFGDYHTRYPETVYQKVFYTGENIKPGIHKSISFEPDSEKNLRLPLWVLYIDHFGIPQTGNSPSYLIPKEDLYRKVNNTQEHFCGFVFSNTAGERVNLFNSLSKYKEVTSGGPLLNNFPLIPKGELEKISFLRKCKFSCCFENSSSPGYTTEKLLHGLVSGGVPLYWGGETDDFNPKRYLRMNTDTDSFVDLIKQVDTDSEMYNEILAQPIFTPDQKVRFEEYLPRTKNFLLKE